MCHLDRERMCVYEEKKRRKREVDRTKEEGGSCLVKSVHFPKESRRDCIVYSESESETIYDICKPFIVSVL